MGVQTGSDVAFAFLLVVGAGLATTLGAAFAFCAKVTNKLLLAASLGASAGVMLYVSFVEIFVAKAVGDFETYLCPEGEEEGKAEGPSKACDTAPDRALQYATLCFFGGILVTYALDKITHLMMPSAPTTESASVADSAKETSNDEEMGKKDEACDAQREMVQEMLEADHHDHLKKVGLMSGLAVALHNFPEGLATFVSALADPASGVAIAIAIALHNIPEGVVVAMPVYYSTGSRVKGFLWAFLSGVSEPIGGLVGWLILSNMGEIAYAVLFAVVAGMMVYISMTQLIPTALRFDPEDVFVSKSVYFGMAVMAASLLMFTV